MVNTMRLRLRRMMWITALAIGALAGGQALMTASAAKRPAEREFGLGPRVSANGMFTAMLLPVEPVRVRTLQSMTVVITDASMHPVDNAQLTIDGGMPRHGHGLPTKPRVTSHIGGGVYEIDGVRFNMGGWWEFKVAITTPAGTDVVTFNLNL
ncbi:MAG TPA: FixH family protein [Steroidobacteraceae bacterium]|nr:FixH family protein [Steroidobacteraceae bacterium]